MTRTVQLGVSLSPDVEPVGIGRRAREDGYLSAFEASGASRPEPSRAKSSAVTAGIR